MKLKSISKVYHNKHNTVEALKDINLELTDNGLVVLLGSSGCGKTTLLNIMAQIDKNFAGELIDVPNTIYLTQDVQLMESMSVEDNLLIVNPDKGIVENYLTKYGLLEHRHKKVKKCSSGQKKRVQFIRALLVQPGLLLCDEPTSALDHENAELLMGDLKDVSKSMQVILVTHDIALAEKYADRIITMDKGRISDDQLIKQNEASNQGKKVEKKSCIETFTLSCKNLVSSPLQTLLFFVLSVCSVTALFVGLNIYVTTESATEFQTAFQRGDNLILSLPNESRPPKKWEVGFYTPVYDKYDFYQYKDIERLIKENPDIIAVEMFRSAQYIRYVGESGDFLRSIDQGHGYKRFFISDNPGDEMFFLNRNLPYSFPFLVDKEMEKMVRNFGTIEWKKNDLTMFESKFYENSFSQSLSIFDLVNGFNEIPLLYGTMPSSPKEIVLDRNTAELLLKLYEIDEIEKLLNMSFPIMVKGSKNDQSYSYLYDYPYYPADMIDVTISGITSLRNDNMYMAFFNQGIKNNPVLNHFVEEYDEVVFEYVRFFTNPNNNTDKIVNNLNESLPLQFNKFVKYDGEGFGKPSAPQYRSPIQFLSYGAGAISALAGLYVVTYFFLRKKIRKESNIMNTYGYKVIVERILRLGMIYGAVLTFCLISMHSIVNQVNEGAQRLYYERFMKYDPLLIVLVMSIVMLFHFVVEMCFAHRRNRV